MPYNPSRPSPDDYEPARCAACDAALSPADGAFCAACEAKRARLYGPARRERRARMMPYRYPAFPVPSGDSLPGPARVAVNA